MIAAGVPTARWRLHKHRRSLKLTTLRIFWTMWQGNFYIAVALEHSQRRQTTEEARTLHALRQLRSNVHSAVKIDKNVWLHGLATQADSAAKRGDAATLYSVVRSLKGGKAAPHRAVRDEDGTLLVQEELVNDRWRQHWKDIFQADILTIEQLQANHGPPHAQLQSLTFVIRLHRGLLHLRCLSMSSYWKLSHELASTRSQCLHP